MNDDLATWAKLEVIFESKFGPVCGNQSLDHEGLRISRNLRRLPSDSGKSHTWRIDFTLRNEAGEVTHISDPATTSNRANDPDRNWGMKRSE
jgi:hypothetical protein